MFLCTFKGIVFPTDHVFRHLHAFAYPSGCLVEAYVGSDSLEGLAAHRASGRDTFLLIVTKRGTGGCAPQGRGRGGRLGEGELLLRLYCLGSW